MTWVKSSTVAPVLQSRHYLGSLSKGIAWQDGFGVIVLSTPTARNVPAAWLELARWCIVSDEENAGSQQWAAFARALRRLRPEVTTIVSYSDPSVGHRGALYRACNWLWAPTWHRLRPPPTGNGKWAGKEASSVKDRWIFKLRRDADREAVLIAKDESILRRMPWARYNDKTGADFRRFTQEHSQ
jgi:hypothetical protein